LLNNLFRPSGIIKASSDGHLLLNGDAGPVDRVDQGVIRRAMMDRNFGFGRLERTGGGSLGLSGPAVTTALAEELFLSRPAAAWGAPKAPCSARGKQSSNDEAVAARGRGFHAAPMGEGRGYQQNTKKQSDNMRAATAWFAALATWG
jgi:hypothetical protein